MIDLLVHSSISLLKFTVQLADWPELIQLLSQRGLHPTVEPTPAYTKYLVIQIFAQKKLII